MTSKLPHNEQDSRTKDKRRAALLSLLLHALFILLIALYRGPQPKELESYLVIDVGIPAFSETETLAPAADAPAPQAAEPLVAANEAGTPQAQTAPEAPPVPAPTPQETPVAETPTETPTPPTQPETQPEEVAETPPPAPEPTPEPQQVAETPPQEPTPPEPEPQPEPEVAPEPVPEPQVAEAAPPAETELPETEQATATLPEIESPEAAPEAQAIALPTPTPQVEVAPAVSVATEATVQVAPEQPVPTPNVQTDVAESQEIPQPEIETSVAEAAPIPQPEAQTTVAEAQEIPQPQAAASVAAAQTVPTPNAQASVAQAQAVPLPGAQASVTAAQAIPSPSVQASVAASQEIPQPQAQASVTPAPSDAQGTQSSSATSNSQATTDSSVAAEGEEGTSGPPLPNAVTATANAMGQRAPEDGGNASTSGQTTEDPNASADNLGLAASPDGVGEGTGAPFAKVPYRENRDRPLNVMIDNTFGYPQAGLREASMVIEMPVEGGSTRLMTMYDRVDPSRVGPVRSARDYFHALSTNMDGILVHDGGSPQAMAAIERSSVPTLNAYNNGPLFERGRGEAPYNLFSSGTSLRQAVAKLNLNKSRAVSGTIFRPEDAATTVTKVSVNYSGIYDSGFEYIEDLDQYRWIRNGDNAVDYSGEAVYANAVVVASIEARELPDDPAGRLYIPLESSRATLYIRGKAIEGNWSPDGGVRFTSSLGEPIDLTPFKTWVLFTPTYADVTQE